MNRRAFIRTVAGLSVTGAVAATTCAYGDDTHDIEITRVPLQLGLQKPLRLVLLGDIHFDPVYDEEYMIRVVNLVNSLQADLIAYTGDFVTAHLERVTDLARILALAQAPRGVLAVPGNHEGWTDRPYVQRVIAQHAGIRMLCNESVPLPGEDNLYLTGFDTFSVGRPRLGLVSESPADARHIVLVHEPDSFNQLTDPRIKLQISGHTHGGQVRVPFVGALVLPHLGHYFQQGYYARGTRQLYVNRGIGTMGLHLRINCRPEITLLELT